MNMKICKHCNELFDLDGHLKRAAGGKISREPGPVKGGSTVIAFVEDPTGYKIELIETAGREI